MEEREENYFCYQEKFKELEKEREDLERKWKDLERDKEQSIMECREDRGLMENLLGMWGECEASNVLCQEFEDTVEEEKQELKKREEILAEKKLKNRRNIIAWEEKYQEKMQSLDKEEENLWQG